MNSKLKHDASVFVEEAQSRLKGIDGVSVAQLAVELALSGWTPPDPIGPRVRAARKWLIDAHYPTVSVRRGNFDGVESARAFLAGFAAAVNLVEPVVEACVALTAPGGFYRFPRIETALTTYRQSIGEGE